MERGSGWWQWEGKMGWMWGLEGREQWEGWGEAEELRVQMGDEANAFVLVQSGRHQQELSRRIPKTLEMSGQQQPAAMALSAT